MTTRFDPHQPRDPDGKFANGMPDVIHGIDLSLGGQSGRLESVPGDKVRFELGGAEVSISRKRGVDDLVRGLEASKGTVDITGSDGSVQLRIHHDYPEVDLEFPHDDVVVRVSKQGKRDLAADLERVGDAQRIEVASGPVDVFWSDDNKRAVRTKIANYSPVTLEFDAKSWDRLGDAENVVNEGFDEHGTFGPAGADVTELTVKTNAGTMVVSRDAPPDVYSGFNISISSTSHDDWFVTHSQDDRDPWWGAWNDFDRPASSSRSIAPATTAGGTPMTGIRRNAGRPRDRATDQRSRFTRQFEVRAQLRDGSDSTTSLEGYASITGTPYTVRDWLGEYDETIERGAFAKTLQERDDVRLLLNHDGMPLARTSSGTMTLAEDDRGLRVVAELDRRSTLTNDVAVAMERGDLTEMSFAFSVTRQEWNEDYTERFIRELKLFDVSVVTYPANPATTAKLRAADLEQLDDDELRELVARAQRRLAPRIDTAAMDALRIAVELV